MNSRPELRTDEELLGAVAHDPVALEELYRRCVGRTVAFAVRRCSTPEQVHDLVAAGWLEVIAASPRFDPARGRALPWILGVMANLARDDRRRRAREQEALRRLAGQRQLDADDVSRLSEVIDAERSMDAVREILEVMPGVEREAFELVAFAGVRRDEAAAALGIEPAAFRMRLARARRRLRAVLDHDEDMEVVRR
jgi:RNA polymerase sigma-70 factor (ECF subfamily)